MIVAALLLGLAAFIAVLRILRAERVARRVASTAQTALRVMSDPDKSDDEKEREVRRASVTLLGLFLAIAGIGVAALGATAAVVWGGAQAGLYSLDAAIAVASSWPFLIGSTVGAVVLWLALDRLGRNKPAPEAGKADKDMSDRDEVPYGPMEQALHNFAFASPAPPKASGIWVATSPSSQVWSRNSWGISDASSHSRAMGRIACSANSWSASNVSRRTNRSRQCPCHAQRILLRISLRLGMATNVSTFVPTGWCRFISRARRSKWLTSVTTNTA